MIILEQFLKRELEVKESKIEMRTDDTNKKIWYELWMWNVDINWEVGYFKIKLNSQAGQLITIPAAPSNVQLSTCLCNNEIYKKNMCIQRT